MVTVIKMMIVGGPVGGWALVGELPSYHPTTPYLLVLDRIIEHVSAASRMQA